jgi:hypothetical protein
MESMFPAIRTKFAKPLHAAETALQQIDAARQSISTGQVTPAAVQHAAAAIARIIIDSRDTSLLNILRHAQGVAKTTHPLRAEDVYRLHELIDQRM